MIVTNNDECAERFRLLRWVGITKDTWVRAGETKVDDTLKKYSWYYDVRDIGHKFQLTDILASLALVQLRRLSETNARRREIRDRYNAGFRDTGLLERPVEKPYTRSAVHNYVIKTEERDALNVYLAEHGVSTGVHYIPNNLYAMYKGFGGSTPVAHDVWKRILTLPLFPDLTDGEVDSIIELIRSFRS